VPDSAWDGISVGRLEGAALGKVLDFLLGARECVSEGDMLGDVVGRLLDVLDGDKEVELGGLLGDPLERSDGDILWDVLGDTL
jgi:hypothetical protein